MEPDPDDSPDFEDEPRNIRPPPKPPHCRGIPIGDGNYTGCSYGYGDVPPFTGPCDCPVCNGSGIEGRCQSELTRDIILRMARTAATMTQAEFRQLFWERFGREYCDLQPLPMFTPEERELVAAYVVAGYVLDQVTYCDSKTNLTYEVFYDLITMPAKPLLPTHCSMERRSG